MKTRRILILASAGIFVLLSAAMLLYSCGGGGGSASTATVALYVTDDMSGYQQVNATINRIDLVNTGSGNSCNVFTGPLTLDISNLAGIMQLIDVGSCPAVPYNRIHIEFAKSVALMDASGNTSDCMFTSYKDGHNNVNKLACGAEACTLDINGAVNLLVSQPNKIALDFNLKDFDVAGFGDPSTCSVTMKVSPLHAAEIGARKHIEGFTGLVSNLSTTDQTFDLTRGKTTFSVLYGGITSTQQPGIDSLLQRAQDDGLRVKVLASEIDCASRTITATAAYVKVEGTIAADSLDTTAHTFTVTYTGGKTIGVDYSNAVVHGVPVEGGWIEVKLYGYDGTNFLAARVEVEDHETTTED